MDKWKIRSELSALRHFQSSKSTKDDVKWVVQLELHVTRLGTPETQWLKMGETYKTCKAGLTMKVLPPKNIPQSKSVSKGQ
jgi:hypothetical protein